MIWSRLLYGLLVMGLPFASSGMLCAEERQLYPEPIDVKVPPIASDPSVKYDYDIVYVRAQRAGDEVHKRYYTDIATPVTLEPGADLMLLHPDGSEELLVAAGEQGAITDPVVSFDGQSVFYTQIHTLEHSNASSPPRKGADIFKLNLKTREKVQLTRQQFTPNTGAAEWGDDYLQRAEGKNGFPYGVLNFGAYPLPGGKLVFVSNRNGFVPARGYPRICLQLFVMNDDGTNIEQIGYLNLAGALHPVTLRDGRIMFSSLESQGHRNSILWGVWQIRPDGTQWGPIVSAFDTGGAPNAFHFQSQLTDETLVVEEYYNQNTSGFGAFFKVPPRIPAEYASFGPAYTNDPRNPPLRTGRHYNSKPKIYRLPFSPWGIEALTPFANNGEGPADPSLVGDKSSPAVGKFTHPSGAPDNHLLTIYSPGPVNHQYTFLPQLDGGIYLIKDGRPISEPAQMLLIKNDPKYNESWPRAVVPYRRMFGVAEPETIPPLANDGSLSPELPAGTPFGLVGTSSLYKRESYPNGVVPPGKVTATYAGGNDPWRGLDEFTSHGNGVSVNWNNQGADAGLYENEAIHAIRILFMEPTTDRRNGPHAGRRYFNHAHERLRIAGEIPVRKFVGGQQPLDPDGNPDTSFLVKIPADVGFTFQTLDARGMLLNSAQTWHQLRPGEIRHDCGGCHAHSQQPTRFEDTFAASKEYEIFDLTKSQTPLIAAREMKQAKSQPQWDAANATGVRYEDRVKNVEYHRDIQPILQRSCIACHTKHADQPAGNLVLDDDDNKVRYKYEGEFPATYYRLAADESAQFGHKPPGWDSWGQNNASRYIRKFQSRRSLLVWKILGERTDGFSNDDHPSESKPGAGDLMQRGEQLDLQKHRAKFDIDFVGSIMPPPAAIDGTAKGPDGSLVKVAPLTDEDKRTLFRWIDLGCPIDLDYNPAKPDERGYGWMLDDNRPTLTVTYPHEHQRESLTKILVGMHDYYTGLDRASFRVVTDFPLNGTPAGVNLASRMRQTSPGVWELKLEQPIAQLERGKIVVSIRDMQGNTTTVDRLFTVETKTASR
jgi:hypothetical protein